MLAQAHTCITVEVIAIPLDANTVILYSITFSDMCKQAFIDAANNLRRVMVGE